MKMNYNEENMIKLLSASIESLSQYAHHRNCDLVYSCPEKHESCKTHLDLDTSIAWELSHRIGDLYNDLIKYGFKNNKNNTLKLREFVLIIKAVVSRHKEKYYKLVNELKGLTTILDLILSN